MINSIEWHRECLKNMKLTCASKVASYQKAFDEAERIKKDILILEVQISTAVNQGRDKFDREKFLKKRAKRCGSPRRQAPALG